MSNQQGYVRSPKAALKYYYITSAINSCILIFVLALLLLMTHYFNWWSWLDYIFYGLILLVIINFVVRPWIKYRYTFFCVTDTYVAVDKRFFFKTSEMIKLERIQYLERHENPISQRFKLSTCDVTTAGHELSLPAMKQNEMIEIESSILHHLRGVDVDV